jgi:thymidylate kinase
MQKTQKKKNNGLFIVLYGVNGVGKTTQALKLWKKINENTNLRAEYLKFPDYDLAPSGPRINDYLRKGNPEKLTPEQFQELCAKNRRDAEPGIKGMLAEGRVVIAEDWVYGGIVWGIATGLTEQRACEINKDFIKADISILLNGKSFAKGKEEEHTHEGDSKLLDGVFVQYLLMADKEGLPIVEAEQSKEKVSHDLWDIIKPELAKL